MPLQKSAVTQFPSSGCSRWSQSPSPEGEGLFGGVFLLSFLTDTMVCGFSLYHIFAFFLIYSCLGWCLEVIYAAATTGQLVNRGFLNGPVCPI